MLQGLVSERDKAFRAQAFALKQANTRVTQLQQQQAELASREAALMQELSHGALQGQASAAESILLAPEHGSSLKKMQSRLPSGMETMRRRLEPILSAGQTPYAPFPSTPSPLPFPPQPVACLLQKAYTRLLSA